MRLGFLVLVALLVGAAPAAAYTDVSRTDLLSHTPGGHFPNGPSFHAAFSQDQKVNRYAAFESDASDLVSGDTNGMRDVFVVQRQQPYSYGAVQAVPWNQGATSLVSTGMGGAPANGPSSLPDLDGDQLHTSPHCVAFISAADNLVPGDTNGRPDAFVKNLNTGGMRLVSVNSLGQQANGASYNVQVDGACDRVAFTSDATNLALTSPVSSAAGNFGRRRTPSAGAVTTAPAANTKQVYMRILGGEHDDIGLGGLTFLASASNSRQAANGSSYDVDFGNLGDSCPKHCGTTSGDTLAFTSEATNLGRDNNGQPDVYQRSFVLPRETYLTRRKHKPRILRGSTRLVSAGRDGQAGNGASFHPSLNDSGQYVAFATKASDLLGGDDNQTTDIARADMGTNPPTLAPVSESHAIGKIGNGPSDNPSVSRPGSPIYFDTEATNMQPSPPLSGDPLEDRNSARDIVFWNIVSRNASVESRDTKNFISGNPGYREPPTTHPVSDATNPASSGYANYVAFESSDPLLDLSTAQSDLPDLLGNLVRTALAAHTDPNLHQVYLRFFGP